MEGCLVLSWRGAVMRGLYSVLQGDDNRPGRIATSNGSERLVRTAIVDDFPLRIHLAFDASVSFGGDSG
jgi:hypothetical protein